MRYVFLTENVIFFADAKSYLTSSLFTITYYFAKNPAKLVKSEE